MIRCLRKEEEFDGWELLEVRSFSLIRHSFALTLPVALWRYAV